MRLTESMQTTVALMRSRCRWLLTMLMVSLLQPASMASAQTDADQDQYAAIEIIRLQHRDAEPIRTLVLSALDPRGSIGLIDNNLIVASTRANLRELRTLIQQLDLPRQSLLISINFDFSVSEHIQSVQILEGDTVIIREQRPVLRNGTETDTDGVVADALEAADNATNSTPTGEPAMALSTRAEIRGSQIFVTLQNATLATDQAADNQAPGTSLSISPGQWVLINPLALVWPVAEDGFSDTTADTAADTAGPAVDSLVGRTTDTFPEGLRQLAVRVELLP